MHRREQGEPSRMSKPLCPFGKRALSPPPNSAFWIFVGQSAWRCAQALNRAGDVALVLPEGELVSSYRLPVAGRVLMFFWPDAPSSKSIRNVVFELLVSGAERVRVIGWKDFVPLTREAAA